MVGFRRVTLAATERWGSRLPATGLVLAALAGVVLVTGCGSSKSPVSQTAAAQPSSSSSTQAPSDSSSTSPATSTGSAQQGASYAGTATVPAGGFTFNLSFNITLGAASTNTDGMTPPYVNVVAPVSGTVTIKNMTAGYTANLTNIPVIGVFALYPTTNAICEQTFYDISQFNPGPKGLCGVDIADLASGCASGAAAIQSLAPHQSGELAVWPNGPNSLSPAAGGGPAICATTNVELPNTFEFSNIDSGLAQKLTSELSAPPRYWAVANESDNPTGCGENDEGEVFAGAIIASKPSGVTGCLGNSNTM